MNIDAICDREVGIDPAAGALREQPHPVQRRWLIWAEQERSGREACYGTEKRFYCEDVSCPWRAECLSLRAEWRR